MLNKGNANELSKRGLIGLNVEGLGNKLQCDILFL